MQSCNKRLPGDKDDFRRILKLGKKKYLAENNTAVVSDSG